MPYDITTFHLPGGTRCSRVVGTGHISKVDVDYLADHILPGKPLNGVPMLCLTQEMKGLSPEARKLFSGSGGPRHLVPWCAVVVTNPVIRVTMNFILRIGKSDTLRLFTSETEAIQWLADRAHAPGRASPRTNSDTPP